MMIDLEAIATEFGNRGFSFCIMPNPLIYRDKREDMRSRWFIDLTWKAVGMENSFSIRRYEGDTPEEVLNKAREASLSSGLRPQFTERKGRKINPDKPPVDTTDLFAEFSLEP